MPLPYQGRPGQYDPLSPTLIPNFNRPVINASGGMDMPSTQGFVNDYPRVAATALVTIGGTIAAGNTVTLTLTQGQLPSGAISATYTCVTSDTVQTVAEGLVTALNTALRAANISTVWATSGSGSSALEAEVIANWNGPLGNFAVLSGTNTGSISLTFTPSNGALSGGSGAVVCANNFNYSYNGNTMAFYYGQAYNLDSDILVAMVSQDRPMV